MGEVIGFGKPATEDEPRIPDASEFTLVQITITHTQEDLAKGKENSMHTFGFSQALPAELFADMLARHGLAIIEQSADPLTKQ